MRAGLVARAWHMHMHAEFTSTSELPFASLEQVLVLNVSHENDLIFMRMNIQVIYIFIPIVLHKDSFCHRGKSKLGIGLFIHELLREPLIQCSNSIVLRPPDFRPSKFSLKRLRSSPLRSKLP